MVIWIFFNILRFLFILLLVKLVITKSQEKITLWHYLILDWHKSQCHYLLLCRIRKSLRSSKDSRIYAGWHLKFKFLAYLLSLDFLKVCQLDSHRGFENHGYSHQSYRRLVWSWEECCIGMQLQIEEEVFEI